MACLQGSQPDMYAEYIKLAKLQDMHQLTIFKPELEGKQATHQVLR